MLAANPLLACPAWVGVLATREQCFPQLTIEHNIFGRVAASDSGVKRGKRLDSLLEEFNLTKVRKSKGSALSGGERRRAGIGNAACQRSQLCFAE